MSSEKKGSYVRVHASGLGENTSFCLSVFDTSGSVESLSKAIAKYISNGQCAWVYSTSGVLLDRSKTLSENQVEDRDGACYVRYCLTPNDKRYWPPPYGSTKSFVPFRWSSKMVFPCEGGSNSCTIDQRADKKIQDFDQFVDFQCDIWRSALKTMSANPVYAEQAITALQKALESADWTDTKVRDGSDDGHQKTSSSSSSSSNKRRRTD